MSSALDNPYLVTQDDAEAIDVLGPTVEILTPGNARTGAPCLIRGTIPAGGFVPLHSHADPETFVVVSGTAEGLTRWRPEPEWTRIAVGDVLHVPSGAPHAWRNTSAEPVVNLIATTPRIAEFFREVGGSPSIARFHAVARRYGYWNASAEENAELGLGTG